MEIDKLTRDAIVQFLVYLKNPFLNLSFSLDLILALDDVRDPGNMGTIIRLADWFGIKTLFCSPKLCRCL